MLSLNLLPSSSVTFSKPSSKHTINASLLNPNPAQLTQNRAFRNPTPDFNSSLSISQIPKSRSISGPKLTDPFTLPSRLSATADTPQDPTPDPDYHKAIASIGKPSTFYLWVMVSGIFYHLYNQSSYEALDDISPLSFSVGNTMKRVVVIVATVLVFRNPVQPLNALGSAIAIFGTFLYSQATAKKPKKD